MGDLGRDPPAHGPQLSEDVARGPEIQYLRDSHPGLKQRRTRPRRTRLGAHLGSIAVQHALLVHAFITVQVGRSRDRTGRFGTAALGEAPVFVRMPELAGMPEAERVRLFDKLEVILPGVLITVICVLYLTSVPGIRGHCISSRRCS